MLNFDLTEEQQILRDSIRAFAEKEIKPIAEELDTNEEFSLDLFKKMAEIGLFGMFVSEEYGGSNIGYVGYIIAVEELARVDGSAAATGCLLRNRAAMLSWWMVMRLSVLPCAPGWGQSLSMFLLVIGLTFKRLFTGYWSAAAVIVFLSPPG